ncbi:beta-lactamase family protein [Aestuariibacter halophilus]|uniref:Beta-lactamase family protein n=1 Tax=Fluctibacter halophilus TaxID=226011 RepID=A0ABS8G8G3_9ALTE|nr:serine hydrolase domain-containing protein [Aestuariibacter halophilus]MCC2616823.1 beta-lactamase family protein [Aestuariibacter halophilus]
MRPLLRLTALLLMAVTPNLCAEESALDTAFLNALVNDIKSSAALPSGTAVAVVHNDRIIYQDHFGYLDIENRVAADANSRFYIASVTKPFVALNYLLDANTDSGLETVTLSTMFPELALPDREDLTAKALLTHTASINNFPLVLATAYSGVHSPASLARLVTEYSAPSSEAVGEFKYTNVGYNIYSVYADSAFKRPWQDKLQQQVFAPAGMQATTARRSDIGDQALVAKPYSLMNPQRQTALYLEKGDNTLHAAGGVFSTAADMGRFLIAQLNEGMIDGKQVYPAEVIARSHRQQAVTDRAYLDFTRDGYAWGWYTGDYKAQRMLHHFGGFAGTHAHLSFIPAQKIGLVVLNSEDFLSARLTNLIADYVYGSLLGEADIEQRVTQRADELKQKLAGLDGQMAKQRQKINGREWRLSLPQQHYVGEYRHPQLGSIFVRHNEEQRFDVEWGVMHSSSTGMNEADKIRVELEPTSGTVITFNVDDQVQSLEYGGVVFNKL